MKTILLLAFGLLGASALAQDWQGIPVPADPGTNRMWRLHPQSDDFNYTHPAEGGRSPLFDKWIDSYPHAWRGPGLTVWDRAHVVVRDGQLRIPASRRMVDGKRKVATGCISSRMQIRYPVYVEARARISNALLASDVWMLSSDSTQEIDILEAYGADGSDGAGKDQTWYSHRVHLSHHVFIRRPFQDYQPMDEGTWLLAGTPWRNDFHRFGVHWKDPWNLDYYVDGKLVRSVSGPEIIDPKGYTAGTGLDKPMGIIINVEDQAWRSDQGLTPTDKELKDVEGHTYRVDWIRVYKPSPKD